MTSYVPEGIVIQKPEGVAPYKEQLVPPPQSLIGLVQQFWRFEWALPDGVDVKSWVTPSGQANIVFQFEGARGWQGRVIGPRTKAFQSGKTGHGVLIGALLCPASLFYWTGREAKSLADAYPRLEEVFGLPGNTVVQSICEAMDDFHKQVEVLSAFLEPQWSAKKEAESRWASEVFAEIASADDVTCISKLAEKFDCSERTIQRLFDRHIGISPKFLVRTRRFQGAVKTMMNRAAIDWADLSLSLGYYDQAHLLKDFRDITGRCPSELGQLC